MKGPGARGLAWRVLDDVRLGVPFDRIFEEALDSVPDARDRALVAELVRGVLTWQARYDHLIDHFASKPGRIKPRARIVLRLGLHQLLALDRVPDHAAVNESVTLARKVVGPSATGFVNGLLKSVIRTADAKGDRQSEGLKSLFPDSRDHPVAYLAAWHSHPVWLVERWLSRFGHEETERLLMHANKPAPVDLHALHGSDLVELQKVLMDEGFACEPLSDQLGLRLNSRPSRDDLSRLLQKQPALLVQDASVQAATRWLASGVNGPLLDLCAAPGGKTAHMRALLEDPFPVIAMDAAVSRMPRLRENLVRTTTEPVAVLCADGRKTPFPDGSFQTVLLDGPCSGSGVIRHHPEGRWRLQPHKLISNGERLLDLAREAHRVLVPGGRLLYATCSLEPEENQGVLEKLRGEIPGLIPDPGLEGSAGRSWLPWRDGGDGFFAARLQKDG